jgi:hypothetical protein
MMSKRRGRSKAHDESARTAQETEELVGNLPSVVKNRDPLDLFAETYFPAEKRVINAEDDYQTWAADPARALSRLAALCQSQLTKAGVYEIRFAAKMPWKYSIAQFVHRRHPKIITSKKATQNIDKPTPRSTGTPTSLNKVLRKRRLTLVSNVDIVVVDPPIEGGLSHQVIRIYASCFCGGLCLDKCHRPKIWMYYSIMEASDEQSLKKMLGREGDKTFYKKTSNGAHELDRKVPQELTDAVNISRFWIQVVEPHVAECRPTVDGSKCWNNENKKKWRLMLKENVAALQVRQDAFPAQSPCKSVPVSDSATLNVEIISSDEPKPRQRPKRGPPSPVPEVGDKDVDVVEESSTKRTKLEGKAAKMPRAAVAPTGTRSLTLTGSDQLGEGAAIYDAIILDNMSESFEDSSGWNSYDQSSASATGPGWPEDDFSTIPQQD